MSRHSTPASASARRIAIAPISIAGHARRSGRTGAAPLPRSRRPLRVLVSLRSLSRPAGTRTSRPRCRRRRCGTAPARAPSPCRCASRVGIGLGEARLDLHLARQLDVADAERHERVARRPRVRRRRRREVLRRPRPQPAAPRSSCSRHVGRRAARARVLRGERDDPARGAAAPDQLRLVARPREDAFGHRDSAPSGPPSPSAHGRATRP